MGLHMRLRHVLSALLAVALLVTSGGLQAQDASAPASAPSTPASAPVEVIPLDLLPNPGPTSSPLKSQTIESQSGDARYEAAVQETEEKVSDLKERVFRSKARLLLLKEALVGGAFGSSKVVIIHRNDMSRALSLQQASYSLDGASIFNRTDLDDSGKTKEFEIFNQPISPGSHTLSVLLVYKGDGFGVFDYLNNYTFRIKSSFTFQVEDGKITQVKVVGYEKGGPLVRLEDRPTVRFDTAVTKAKNEKGATP